MAKEKMTKNDMYCGSIEVTLLGKYSDSVRIMRRWKSGK